MMRMTEENNQAAVTKIVITGGPCAGKTTGMSWIQNAFTELGYLVLFIPETATELIQAGMEPKLCRSTEDFQKSLLSLQLAKEKVFEQTARTMKASKVLIVCDRGALDNKAYMSEDEFARMMDELGVNEIELRDNYDAVFHLTTAAKGARNFYTTENNSARKETPDEAAVLDDKLIAAWTGHPHLRIVDNSTEFKEKMRRLIAEISSFLGETEPYVIKRKFLIEYPDLAWLQSLPNCQRVEIIQTYLKSDKDEEEVRVRQRGTEGNYIYTQTIKKIIAGAEHVENERRLSEREYLRLLMKADTDKRQIRKDRYCLTYENQYFEIDVYPLWDDQAIVDLELTDKEATIHFPEEIKVIKEVTDDIAYRNSTLAKR